MHETFTAADIAELRAAYPKSKIIAHPECPPEVIDAVDFSGSTAAMINWVKTEKPPKVVMVTECSMSDNVALQNPNVNFVRPCNLCPHMKRISLPKILTSLQTMEHKVEIDPAVSDQARLAIQRMIDLPLNRQSMYNHQHPPHVMAVEARASL